MYYSNFKLCKQIKVKKNIRVSLFYFLNIIIKKPYERVIFWNSNKKLRKYTIQTYKGFCLTKFYISFVFVVYYIKELLLEIKVKKYP